MIKLLSLPSSILQCLRVLSARQGIFTILTSCGLMCPAFAGGVTVITHGFNGNITDWIIPMADRLPGYPSFPDGDVSCYQISVTSAGATAEFLGGGEAAASPSGEIVVKLDWSDLAGIFGGASSTSVAEAAAEALLSPSLIPELGGRSLAELPLHLLGHSRGGSVVTEMARLLGAQGVWVDQVTTMDPRPVPLFGDAAVATYANVLFADNYWQDMGDGLLVPNGQSLAGAFNRKLVNLGGGYSSSHSDAHLWYHGTIELGTPATDSMATITSSQRSSWWKGAEVEGANAGFFYSRIGGGDRLSALAPAGGATGMVREGFNQKWDLGGGVADNRTPLPSNSGLWPNVISLQIADGGPANPGERLEFQIHYQSGATASGEAELQVFLDQDRNPWNGTGFELNRRVLANTGTSEVAAMVISIPLDNAGVPPGTYTLCTAIHENSRSRFLHASGNFSVGKAAPPPVIDPTSLLITATEFRFNVHALPGQNVAIEATTDFNNWITVETLLFNSNVWEFRDAGRLAFPNRYYRAALAP